MEAIDQRSVPKMSRAQFAETRFAVAGNPADAHDVDNSLRVGLDALNVLARALLNEISKLGRGNNCGSVGFSEQVARFEAELIRSALNQTGGRQRRAARLLQMKVSTLHRKIKLYKLTSSAGSDIVQ